MSPALTDRQLLERIDRNVAELLEVVHRLEGRYRSLMSKAKVGLTILAKQLGP